MVFLVFQRVFVVSNAFSVASGLGCRQVGVAKNSEPASFPGSSKKALLVLKGSLQLWIEGTAGYGCFLCLGPKRFGKPGSHSKYFLPTKLRAHLEEQTSTMSP